MKDCDIYTICTRSPLGENEERSAGSTGKGDTTEQIAYTYSITNRQNNYDENL